MEPDYLAKIKAIHSSSYLTLMSITQGVALSFLAFNFFHKIPNLSLLDSIFFATTFLVIVAVWHEYFIAITVLTWIPGMLDSFIPFILAICQIAVIENITTTADKWYLSMAVCCFTGFVAFLNMYIKSANISENQGILINIGKLKHVSIFYPGMAALTFLWFSYEKCVFHTYTLPLFSLLILIGYYIRTIFYWRAILRLAHSHTG